MRMISAVNAPVPCMSGQAGTAAGPGLVTCVAQRVEVGLARAAAGATARRGCTKRSSWRHITPLGMPVVPPV